MYQINKDGYLVDHQGFPARIDELVALRDACVKTAKLGDLGRENLARRVCENLHPEMVDQIDFTKFH